MRQCIRGQGKYVLVYKNSGEVLCKLKSRDFRTTSLSTYAFSTLNTTLPYNQILEKLVDLIERASKCSKMKVRFIMPVMIGKRFSLLQTIVDILFRLVRMYMTHNRIFWIIFTSDLIISYTDKLLVFQCIQIVLLL